MASDKLNYLSDLVVLIPSYYSAFNSIDVSYFSMVIKWKKMLKKYPKRERPIRIVKIPLQVDLKESLSLKYRGVR